jgi:hypothetical protein
MNKISLLFIKNHKNHPVKNTPSMHAARPIIQLVVTGGLSYQRHATKQKAEMNLWEGITKIPKEFLQYF